MQIYSNKLFNNPLDIITAFDNTSFINAFKKIEEYKNKYYIAGYIKYEAKEIFLNKNIKTKYPLLYFEVFDKYETFNDKITQKSFIFEKNIIKKNEYIKNIKKIKNLIKNGITYEVNYTYPVKIYTDSDEYTLFLSLLNEQATAYSYFIKNKYETILSYSPELFFRIENNQILTKPMKGTIQRGKTKKEDEKNKLFLTNDIKNRSENIMIVDLIRNDLSKIAKTGTVKVQKLFETEEYKTLFQMTSEVTAELNNNISLYDVFNALFPSGSITGAPKISTMNIIDSIENYKREVYTGAIGIITPQYTEFSVPIRILQKKNFEAYYKYAQGGAIVWDSDAEDEYNETIIKRKFLNSDANFQLIETMKSENGKIYLFKEHISRLKRSCNFFNFKFPSEIKNLKPQKDGIIRILLSKKGDYTIEHKQLNPIKTNIISIAKNRVNSNNILLYHKTTKRHFYESSTEKIKNNTIFDEIYFNEKEELTEGSRSNIIIEKNKKLYTPPVSAGLLNGTLRTHLLKERKIKEKTLYLQDIKTADNIYCINSIRGIVKVYLQW